MALVVEDGTAKSDAESYDTIANITTFLAAYHPSATWAGYADAIKEQTARQATWYLDTVFGERFDGERYSKAQALDWPRLGAYYKGFEILTNEIPTVLKQALAEVCWAIAEGYTIINSAQTDHSTISSDRTKIGPLEFETRYLGGKEENAAAELERVERVLRPIVTSVGEIERG